MNKTSCIRGYMYSLRRRSMSEGPLTIYRWSGRVFLYHGTVAKSSKSARAWTSLFEPYGLGHIFGLARLLQCGPALPRVFAFGSQRISSTTAAV